MTAGDFRQRDAAAVAERDLELLEIGNRLGAAQRADRLVAAAEIGAAAGHVDVGRTQRPVDVAGGGAERVQPVGVELDLDLARHAAIAVDAGDALQALQLADDRIVDEPRKLFERHGRRRDGIGQDRLPFDVDAVDDRRLGSGRQVGADALDRVLGVVDGGLRVDLEAELDDGLRGTFGDRRRDVLDAGNVGDRVLDALGDLRLKLARRDARVGHRDRDDRHVDVGEARDRQLRKAHQSKRQQHDEHQDRRNRVADRPCGKIPAH